MAGSLKKRPLGSIFLAVIFEPETAGCEARMLALCYAVPKPAVHITLFFLENTQIKENEAENGLSL